jgi:hypothetical protein
VYNGIVGKRTQNRRSVAKKPHCARCGIHTTAGLT